MLRSFYQHPSPLKALLTTEVAERFAYYGMQALLVLYLTNDLLNSELQNDVWMLPGLRHFLGGLTGKALASAIVGIFGALVFLSPLLGGFVADRYWGKRRTILTGGGLLAAGYFLLTAPATSLLALIFVIAGTGCFKSNLASQVGDLYTRDDPLRNDAFQYRALAINIGAIASPLVIGSVGEKAGWNWGFALSGIVMLAVTIGYAFATQETTANSKPAINPDSADEMDQSKARLLILLVPIFSILTVPNAQLMNAYIVWADGNFDFMLGGFRVPTSWLMFIAAASSAVAIVASLAFWNMLRALDKEPGDIAKILLGSILVMAGMLGLGLAAFLQAPGTKIHLGWALLCQFLNNFGYAQVIPVGMAMFTRLSPQSWGGTSVGLFFISLAGASLLAGYIGTFLTTLPVTYFWLLHAALALVAFAALVIADRFWPEKGRTKA